MTKVNPEDYDFLFKVDNLSYFFSSCWLHNEYRKRDFLLTNKQPVWKVYVSKKEWERLSDEGLKLLEEGMPDFRNRTHSLLNKAKELFPEVEKKDLSKHDNKQLASEFEGFILFVRRLWELFFFTEYFMHDKVQKKTEKLGINSPKYLTSSPKEMLPSKEFYERCQLAKNPSEDALLNHVKKYIHIFYNEGGETLTLEKLKDEIKKIKNPDEKIKEIDKKHEKIISQRKHHKLSDAVREMAELKYIIRCFINKTVFGDNLVDKYLREISKRTDIHNFENYHYKEIIDILNGKDVIEKDRSNFVRGKFNDWGDILGGQALEIINILDSKYNKSVDIIEGKIGNKGFYVGRVKIIPFDVKADLAKEIDKMSKGDVLVTGSTGPEMIVACHKAGAIVTDEGGICSHAAIVSRELGIPSVIATKIATDVLKDGDLVEVDAEKGIVRIKPIQFKKVNWYHDVPNQRAPLYVGSVLINCLKEHNAYYNRTIKDLLFSVKNVFSVRACYSEPDIREGAQSLLNSCLKDPNFLEKTEEMIIQRGNFLLSSARKFESLKGRDLKQLLGLFKEIYNNYTRYFAVTMIPELSTDFVEKEFDNEVKKQFKSEHGYYLNVLSIPRESFLRKEEKELLEISKKKNFKELLKEHVKKYFWIENNYVDTKYLSEDYFINKLKTVKILEGADISKKRELLVSLKDEKYTKLKILTDIIEFLIFVRDIRKRTLMEVSYYINKLLNEIASKKGISLKTVMSLTAEEIFQLDKKTILEEEVLKRKMRVLCYYHNGDCEFYEGEEANKVEQMIAPFDISADKSAFHGRIAYKGKSRGVVTVIKSVEELHKLNEGDILVTSNTTPDFVPFLNKVKAIITEKGGITSHAAIISREMKTPCIVGVKHITSMLKTGDLVEVDAEKGIVRKIR